MVSEVINLAQHSHMEDDKCHLRGKDGPQTAATYTTLGRHNHKKRRRWRKACGRLLLQAIFLTFGLIANLYIVGDVSAELVCGALLAICCAAVGEYARSSAWTIAISVDVGLRRMLHAIMVRDDAGRRIQRGHAARHITERRTTPCGTEPCRLAFAIAEHAAIRCDRKSRRSSHDRVWIIPVSGDRWFRSAE